MKINKDRIGQNIILKLLILVSLLLSITQSYAISDANIKWSTGNVYKMTPASNMITEKEYTIKTVEFPGPVRGEKAIDGSIHPERPVSPFVKLELYNDIINNSKPIGVFILGIGDDYITSDQELRIINDGMSDSNSQDWVYEYYNPWTNIRVQRRSTPTIDLGITLKNSVGDDIGDIKPGDSFKAIIKVKNTGDEDIKNVDIKIMPDPLLLRDVIMTNTLKYDIYQLNANEERSYEISLAAPISLEENQYELIANVTGYDIKDKMYYYNISKTIKVKADIESIYIDKQATRNTSYLKQYSPVVINIINRGRVTINNIQLHDIIPYGMSYIRDGIVYNSTDLLLNKSSIGPSESWTIEYSLKPTEPGIYILPQAEVNFSARGKNLRMTSNEVGFRVFGPKVILNKSAIDMGNGTLEVIVLAKNIGNGITRVVIKDQLPDNATLLSGDTDLITSLDPNDEKILGYTIKVTNTNITDLLWPPAIANYYLDDWKFSTSSDEKYIEGNSGEVGHTLKEGTKAHIVIVRQVATPTVTNEVIVPVPEIEEDQKKVVATIPAKTPIQKEKSIPGFRLYEPIVLLSFLIFRKINRKIKR